MAYPVRKGSTKSTPFSLSLLATHKTTMQNTLQFKITITEQNPTTGSTDEIGEIDLFAFSEKEVYAMYSGKGLNKDRAAACIKQLKKLLRKPEIAPSSPIQLFDDGQDMPSPKMPRVITTQEVEAEKRAGEFLRRCNGNSCDTDSGHTGLRLAQPGPALIESLATKAVEAILAEDYPALQKLFVEIADEPIPPQLIASRSNELLKGISSRTENRQILTPKATLLPIRMSEPYKGFHPVQQTIEVANLPENQSPEILFSFSYKRRDYTPIR